MESLYLIANWKMNKTRADLPGYFAQFTENLPVFTKLSENVKVVFAVPYLLLDKTRELTRALPIQVAAQNLHWEPQGAFTGEISTSMLKEAGIELSLVGHSERRQYFSESDETVAKKVAACLSAGIRPVLCVGENRVEREGARTNSVIADQLSRALANVHSIASLIVAYEPVWAIGTGLAATPEQAQEVHAFIRTKISDKFGKDAANRLPILYGGSMDAQNAIGLFKQPDINGGLVGGASLKPDIFAKLVTLGAAQVQEYR